MIILNGIQETWNVITNFTNHCYLTFPKLFRSTSKTFWTYPVAPISVKLHLRVIPGFRRGVMRPLLFWGVTRRRLVLVASSVYIYISEKQTITNNKTYLNPNSSVFWFITPRKAIWNRRFGTTYRSLPSSRVSLTVADGTDSPETSVLYPLTPRNDPENAIIRFNQGGCLRSRTTTNQSTPQQGSSSSEAPRSTQDTGRSMIEFWNGL